MSKFIKLTQDDNGRPILINVDRLHVVMGGDKRTCIKMIAKGMQELSQEIYVRETPEQILAQISGTSAAASDGPTDGDDIAQLISVLIAMNRQGSDPWKLKHYISQIEVALAKKASNP